MRILFLLFIICFLLPYVVRLLFPWLLRLMSKRMQRRFEQMQQKSSFTSSDTINQSPHHDKKVGKNVGEYVDFEEIK